MDKMQYAQADEVEILVRAKKDAEWISAHYEQLLQKYDNQFIAVREQEILAANSDVDELLVQLEKKGIQANELLVKFITKVAFVL